MPDTNALSLRFAEHLVAIIFPSIETAGEEGLDLLPRRRDDNSPKIVRGALHGFVVWRNHHIPVSCEHPVPGDHHLEEKLTEQRSPSRAHADRRTRALRPSSSAVAASANASSSI